MRLAWSVMRHLYRRPVVCDVPPSSLVYALCYGNWHKLHNLVKLRRAYYRHDLTVDAYPSELRVDPASVCNLHCPLCPTGTREVDRGPGFLSVETFRRILDKFGDHLLYVHLWVWGEPLLNKSLADLVAQAENRRVGTEISTNLSV